MSIAIQTFYGGYKKVYFTDEHYIPVLGARFIRVVSSVVGGELFLPAANTLPLIRGGSVFTIWNEGYFNITLRDIEGGLVGGMQGTSGGTSGIKIACWSNVHLLNATTAAGEWLISCGGVEGEPDSTTTDTDLTGPGSGTIDPPTTTSDGHDDDSDCTDAWGNRLPQQDCLW